MLRGIPNHQSRAIQLQIAFYFSFVGQTMFWDLAGLQFGQDSTGRRLGCRHGALLLVVSKEKTRCPRRGKKSLKMAFKISVILKFKKINLEDSHCMKSLSKWCQIGCLFCYVCRSTWFLGIVVCLHFYKEIAEAG